MFRENHEDEANSPKSSDNSDGKKTDEVTSLLSKNVIQYLWESQKKNFLNHQNKKPSTLGALALSLFGPSETVLLSHSLVQTKPNHWHVIENEQTGKGAFGRVKPSKWVIQVGDRNTATLTQVKDIVKFQSLPTGKKEKDAFCKNVKAEVKYQSMQGVKVYDPIETEDTIIIVAEDCGISLDKLLSSITTFDEWLAISRGICNELLYLLKNEILHRDIKPANICCKETGTDANGLKKYQLIFIDFGLAAEATDRKNSHIVGTLDYMAPELVRRVSTPASDIYAIAGVLLEIGGATDISKYKRAADTPTNPLNMLSKPYCNDGFLGKFQIPQDVDKILLEDIVNFLNLMQDKNPDNRPSAELITKFFTIIDLRRIALPESKNEMVTELKSLSAIFEKIGLKNSNLVKKFFEFEGGRLPSLIVRLLNNPETYSSIADQLLNPESHYTIVFNAMNAKCLLDIEEYGNRAFPYKTPIKLLIQEFGQQLNDFQSNLAETVKLIDARPVLKEKIKIDSNLKPMQQLSNILIFDNAHEGKSELLDRTYSSKFFGEAHSALQQLDEMFANLHKLESINAINRKLEEINSYISKHFAEKQMESQPTPQNKQ